MKLISMTDYILSYEYLKNKPIGMQRDDKLTKIERYANFLKTPLELGMFVPCDEDGNVLEYIEWLENEELTKERILYENEYNQAKERVIFEGFQICICNGELSVRTKNTLPILKSEMENMTIEELTKSGLTLTQNAIKKYGR